MPLEQKRDGKHLPVSERFPEPEIESLEALIPILGKDRTTANSHSARCFLLAGWVIRLGEPLMQASGAGSVLVGYGTVLREPSRRVLGSKMDWNVRLPQSALVDWQQPHRYMANFVSFWLPGPIKPVPPPAVLADVVVPLP
jgi:hypothetical protein